MEQWPGALASRNAPVRERRPGPRPNPAASSSKAGHIVQVKLGGRTTNVAVRINPMTSAIERSDLRLQRTAAQVAVEAAAILHDA